MQRKTSGTRQLPFFGNGTMQHGDAFQKRERALEDSFFHARNQELLAQLKKKMSADNAKQAIRDICHIDDEQVLDNLVAAGIGGESIAALSIAPLVLVAWADGSITDDERRAVMTAAKDEKVDVVCIELLEDWLSQRPDDTLKQAWIGYAGVLASNLPPQELKRLRASVLDRAERVAKASGGVMGLNRVSTSERAMLDDLKAAFTA